MPVVFPELICAPLPSISMEQHTVNVADMQEEILRVRGRHDPCIAVRAVPVIESAAAAALYDLLPRGGSLKYFMPQCGGRY